jgi:hypothetical protein
VPQVVQLELQRSTEARELAQSPLGAVSFGLTADEIIGAALEMVRRDDHLALVHLVNAARERVGEQIEQQDQMLSRTRSTRSPV